MHHKLHNRLAISDGKFHPSGILNCSLILIANLKHLVLAFNNCVLIFNFGLGWHRALFVFVSLLLFVISCLFLDLLLH